MFKNKIFVFISISFFIITGLIFFFRKGNTKNDIWLISTFYGDKDNAFTKSLSKEIKYLLPSSSKIVLKKISKEIVSIQQAENKLKKSKAKLIAWGKIEDGKILLQITRSKSACSFISMDNSIASLLNLKKIEFADDIKNFNEDNKSLIKIFLQGYIQYLKKDYKTAISIWENKFPDNPIISFYLGNAYLMLSQNGKQVKDNQLTARKYYNDIIQTVDKNKNSAFYQSILNNLGVHYLDYPFDFNRERLIKAQNYLQEAVKISPDWSNEEYGITLNNLAITYGILHSASQEKFNKLVLQNFSESLRVFRKHKNKEMQAIMHNNLGVSYFKTKNLTKEYIKESINDLNTAKKLASKDDQPETFYRIINNLGLAYAYNNEFKEVIKYFTLSQEFFNEDIFPIQFGLIQENLGDILFNMPRTDDEGSLIEAIKCYENALRVINQDTRPFNFAQINNNLGLIYSLLKYNKGFDNLKKAENSYKNAIKVFEKDLYPLQYAGLKSNLGNIFVALSKLNETDSSKTTINQLESAIKYFNEALEIYKKLENKRELVMTKVNLANAYTHFPQEKKSNLNKAISIYLEILSSADNKDYHSIVSQNIEAAKKLLQNLENKSK